MARRRLLSPEFATSETLAACSRDARLYFALLWTICDREGRCRYVPRVLHGQLFPFDDDADIEAWTAELEQTGCVVLYGDGLRRYLAIPAWLSHQTPHHREAPSALPEPPGLGKGSTEAKPRPSPGQAQAEPGPSRPDPDPDPVLDPVPDPVRSSRASAREGGRARGLAKLFSKLRRSSVPELDDADEVELKRLERGFDGMLKDGCAPDVLERVIRLSQTDDFWVGRVRDAAGIRKHLDTLVAQLPRREVRGAHKGAVQPLSTTTIGVDDDGSLLL